LDNQGLISSEVSGKTISVTATSMTSSGTLQAINGGILSVAGLTGNLGTATVTDTGSQLILSGTGYVNNAGLTVPTGTTVTLNGSWSSTSAINVTGGTLNLGGTFTPAGVDFTDFHYSSGTVNVTGTMGNTSASFTLNNSTGSWNLAGGTISGGSLNFADGKTLVM